jgi:DNA-binding HxlR family transcriptional regulator
MEIPHQRLPIDVEAACATHPVGRAFRLLGDLSTLLIVNTLMTGTRRFGEVLEAVGNVSPKTVSQRLKMLEELGFVERQAFLEIPPRVEYSLTEKGRALADVMEAIKQFGERYLADVDTTIPVAASPCLTVTETEK